MQAVSIIFEAPEGVGGDLLGLVISRSWHNFSCRITSESGDCVFLKPEMTAIPRQMSAGIPSGQVQTFEQALDFEKIDLSRAHGPLAIINSRYAVEVDSEILLQIAGDSAGVEVLEFTGGASYYDELLRAGGNGQVLGYRRSYHARALPAALPDTWPKLLLIGAPVRHIFAGGSLPASFDEFVALCRRRDVPVRSWSASGHALDLAEPDGLLEYFFQIAPCLPGSRPTNGDLRRSSGVSLRGAVTVEQGSQMGKDVVGVGPLFLGEGCKIGSNAFLSGCIIGPDAEVPANAVLRRQVWLRSGATASGSTAATRTAVRAGVGQGYRRWPPFSYARSGKRIFDFLFALGTMALLAIVFPAIAAAIKFTSKGPIFYRHARQGLRGREFKCLKFRTMITNAFEIQQDLQSINEVDGPQFKIQDDPRVTTVGHFLRATNLDELPQFLNVLAGQMSIVGPRPSPDGENQMCPSWRDARLSVRPGITGLWQVSRSVERRNDFQEWIRYDKEYVHRMSFLRDLTIIGKTVKLMLGRFLVLFQGSREGNDQAT